jgi:hypothetical protein
MDTVIWLDDLGCRAGGFNRSHVVILLLLDWFGINPFPEILRLGPPNLKEARGHVSADTTAEARIKTTFTCQSDFFDVLRRVAPRLSLQRYIRQVLACYAWGEERAFRPQPGAIPPLAPLHKRGEIETETLDFYHGPELLDWVDTLANRTGGFNRSHTMLLLLLDWLRINPFDDVLA